MLARKTLLYYGMEGVISKQMLETISNCETGKESRQSILNLITISLGNSYGCHFI